MKSRPTKSDPLDAGEEGPAAKRLPSAKSKALSFLSRREHSRLELTNKLLQRGYPATEVEEAVAWAIAHKFQSDERFAISLHRRRASTYGDRAIAAELNQHGLAPTVFSSSVTDQAHPSLSSSDELLPEAERAHDWIVRRHEPNLRQIFLGQGKPDSTELLALKAKIFRALAARGFEFGNIDRAWRRVISDITRDT
ncbi:MAG TPA: regulatory protein RecX [Limnobacter sp.]|nr:regulatory protein RecX [Limnobacter sp.]